MRETQDKRHPICLHVGKQKTIAPYRAANMVGQKAYSCHLPYLRSTKNKSNQNIPMHGTIVMYKLYLLPSKKKCRTKKVYMIATKVQKKETRGAYLRPLPLLALPFPLFLLLPVPVPPPDPPRTSSITS